MTLQIGFWQFIGGLFVLLTTFVSVAWLFGVILVRQFKGHLDERFEGIEAARTAADKAMQDELRRHAEEEGKALEQLKNLEREFLEWRADLPLNYVRREDNIRSMSVIEAKLDALFTEVKMVQIKGGRDGH